MVKSKDSILKDYQNNVTAQQLQIASLKKTLNNISLNRLGTLVIEVIFVTMIITMGYHWIIGLLMLLPVLAFLFLVKRQTLVQNQLNYTEKLLYIYQNEVEQLSGGQNKYNDGDAFADELHPYASDLDIYGSSSLYAFINRSNTTNGMKILAGSLGQPSTIPEIQERQQAITELASHINQTFHFRAGLQNHKPEQLDIIEHKMGHQLLEQLKFSRNKLLRFYTKISPVLSIGLLILGSVYGSVYWSVMGIVLLFNLSLIFFNLKHINLVYYGFGGSSKLLNAISGTIKWTEEVDWQSSYIKNFFDHKTSGTLLSQQVRELSGIINSFDVRLNVMIGVFFNAFALWDIRSSIALDKWYSNSSDQLVKGLYRISQFEELISFATFHYNQPDYVMPAVAAHFQLEATHMGHPLITADKRISNEYQFQAQPTVDIITGSNMAGKSTFLRTVGINMVLAFAGAPVCATSMKTSVFELLTYMRIKDSLNDQTSTFKAELNRLKMILEGVKTLAHPLVLIDEMLRGTNSKDKYLGSKVFIQQMIKLHTPTLFATHDLLLSEMLESYPAAIRNYHFDIQLAEGEMNFDYKLKHGACKTFNAAILLKEIGLSFNPEEHL